MGKEDFESAPDFVFCSSQDTWYYGYKLYAVASINGVLHSFDLSKASLHDIKYLDDIRFELPDCTLIGD